MRILRFFALLLLILYVAANILAIVFVPMLHHFTYHLTVIDAQRGLPISGALVTRLPGRGETGRTNRRGQVVMLDAIQEQPKWVFPALGTQKFPRRLFIVEAPGYQRAEVAPSAVLRNLSIRESHGDITISLQPQH